MININKLAAAIVLAAAVAAPASGVLAANSMAAKPAATKAVAAPIADPSGLVGHWTLADITAIDGAKAVKIIDLRKAYPKNLKQLTAAEKADKAAIAKLHTALNSDSKFKAWAKKNHVSLDHVVGVSGGEVAVL